MKSCDYLIILKSLKPKSYQNETFTLKGKNTGTERVFFAICKQNLFTYFVHTQEVCVSERSACVKMSVCSCVCVCVCVFVCVCVCWANTVSSELN